MKPLGNKILAKKLTLDTVSESGVEYAHKGEQYGNSWYEIIALPEVIINKTIAKMEVGGLVCAKEFDYDKVRDLDHKEEYTILDIEPDSGVRAGQVHSYIKPKK